MCRRQIIRNTSIFCTHMQVIHFLEAGDNKLVGLVRIQAELITFTFTHKIRKGINPSLLLLWIK